MHALLWRRSREALHNIYDLLEVMALDKRCFRGLSVEVPPFQSTASTVSLRAPDPVYAPMGPSAVDQSSGNVKVVVRVRGFVKRGKLHVFVSKQTILKLE